MSNDQKIPCVEVRRPESREQSCVYRLKSFSAADEFDGAEEGETISLTLRLMTQAEIDALPEFAGW